MLALSSHRSIYRTITAPNEAAIACFNTLYKQGEFAGAETDNKVIGRDCSAHRRPRNGHLF